MIDFEDVTNEDLFKDVFKCGNILIEDFNNFIEKYPNAIDIYKYYRKTFKFLKSGYRYYVFLCLCHVLSVDHMKLPSSSSGKHHPVEERGEMGQIIHELKVVAQGIKLLKILNIDINSDIGQQLVIACILHDGAKWGIPYNYIYDSRFEEFQKVKQTKKQHTHRRHAEIMALCMTDILNKIDFPKNAINNINVSIEAVRWHYGPWSWRLPEELIVDKTERTDCTQCGGKLKSANQGKMYKQCSECMSYKNTKYLWTGPAGNNMDDISGCHLLMRNNMAMPVFLCHMSDYIVSRYSDDGGDSDIDEEIGLKKEMVSSIYKVIPEMTCRADWVRDIDDILDVLDGD